MGFALLAYNAAAAAAGASNVDLSFVTDPEFSGRNSHFIFTEQYYLGGVMIIEASATRGRFQVPTWNAIGEANILNVNRSLNPPSNPQMDLYLAYPPKIPLNEEFQVQVTNNLGSATEQSNALLWLLTEDWNGNLPRGSPNAPPVILVQATIASFTPTINVWSAPQNISLTASLRGGVYAVVGATVQGSNVSAFRLIFPRYRLYHGRKLRPGGPTQNAAGDIICNQLHPWMMAFGEWGRFHTFELPTVELLGNTAAATSYRLFMWLVFMGEDVSQLNQGLGGGM